MSNYGMNLFFATLWLVMIIAILSPTAVGEWINKVDNGRYGEYEIVNLEDING
jgi:hypothetical protein